MTKTTTTAPDGGWGWVIVIASFLIHFIADGINYSFGVFLPEFVSRFEVSHALAGSIGGILPAVTLGIGPLVSALVNMYGCRSITIVGAIISGIALTITCFATSIYYILVTMGVLLGIGFGLVYVPAIISISYYFEKKRAFVTGLAVCGSGLGTFAFAPLTEHLIAEYTWRGAILIHAGLAFNMIVFGLVMRPLPAEKSEQLKAARKEKKTQMRDEMMRQESEGNCLLSVRETNLDDENGLEMCCTSESTRDQSPEDSPTGAHDESNGPSESLPNGELHKKHKVTWSASVTSTPSKSKEREGHMACSKEIRNSFREIMDLSMLKDPVFLLFAVSNVFTSIGFNVPFIYMKDQGLDMGFDDDSAAFLISGIGIGNTVGRIVFGVIASVPKINKLYVYNIGLVLCGVCVIIDPFFTTFELLLFCAIMFGFFVGSYVTLTSVLLVDLVGLEKLTNAFGLLLLFQGAATVAGAPLCGWIRDTTGSYNIPFWIVGAALTFSGMMLFVIPCMHRRFTKESHDDECPESSVYENQNGNGIEQLGDS